MKKITKKTLSKLEKSKIFGGNDGNAQPDGVSKIARTCGGQGSAPLSADNNFANYCPS